MNAANQRLAQKLIAIVVIIAILGVIGFSPAVIVFFLVAGLVIWRKVRRSEHQETERVFEFYVAADEVLRDETRQWYGFEIAEVIDAGERIMFSLPDPPPLSRFTLGALYHRVGDFEFAVDHLSRVVEDSRADEVHQTTPSPQLRRYVETLRRIEREPAMAPQTLSAIRNLERLRRKHAAEVLAESRQHLDEATAPVRHSDLRVSAEAVKSETAKSAKPLSLITAPPPISEVLRDVYQPEDKKTA
jgi:uncharacterized protein (UPF0335 family)